VVFKLSVLTKCSAHVHVKSINSKRVLAPWRDSHYHYYRTAMIQPTNCTSTISLKIISYLF